MYDLPTVRDRAAYQKLRRTYENPYPCKRELNPEMLEEEAVAAGAMLRFSELLSHLRSSMRRLEMIVCMELPGYRKGC